MLRSILVLTISAASATQVKLQPLELHVCCGCGDDSAAGKTRAAPLNTLIGAQDRLLGLRATAGMRGSATVFIEGTCAPPRPFGPDDGGSDNESRVTYRGYVGEAPAVISGGIPVPASALQPVTGPDYILEQINATALPFIRQIDLAALNVTDLGTPLCHPYMGGEASILPGNLVSAALELFLYGDVTSGGDLSPLALARWPNRDHAPKQWSSGSVSDYTIFVDLLTAPRIAAWARQLREDPHSIITHYLGGLGWDDHANFIASINASGCSTGSGLPANPVNCAANNTEANFDYYGNDIQPPVPAASAAACCALCTSTPGCNYYSYCTNGACDATNCYLKSSNSGRKAFADRISGPLTAPQPPAACEITLEACPSLYAEPGFDSLDNAGTYYSYNVLAELDQEGEYYVNRTSGMLYVWPPSGSASPYWKMAPWGEPVVEAQRALPPIDAARRAQVAELAATDAPIGELSLRADLFVFDGTSYITLDNVVLTTARNAAVRAINSTGIIVSNAIVENVGSMAANASGGSNFSISASVVRHAGNGAIFYYAGDRVTLTSAGHEVSGSTISYSNRYLYCYVPMVALADCGNAIRDCELFGGPHQGTFISGNDHTIEDSLLHDLVETCSDSGTVYMGRDWTYQGNVINNNTFLRINTVDPGDDVSAVYLDDMISGFTITNNQFINISRALLLGGGESITFTGNYVSGVSNGNAVFFDNRGMGWDSGACTTNPPGEMVLFLQRVPYNTSAIWISRFPALSTILVGGLQCMPRFNVIANNVYCAPGQDFIDQSNATIASWQSTAYNNTPIC